MNDINEYLKSYIPVIDFLAEILGRNSEIVLHDLTNLDSSILAIKNNHITKRTVGDPATDYVLRVVKDGIDETVPFSINYRGITKRDNGLIRSASLYIRYKNQLVGMICVNTDETIFSEINQHMEALEVLMSTYKQNETKPSPIVENVSRSVEEMANNAVLDTSVKKGITPRSFKPDDKFETIENLFDGGFFLLKGSVQEIARLLNISEPTVYRYLQTIKESKPK